MNDTCKICDSKTRKFYDKQFNEYYFYCNNCEFISKDEKSLLSNKDEKRQYDFHNNSYENTGYVNMFRDFIDRSIIKYVSSGKNALDFGSGPEPVLAKVLTDEYGYNTDIYDKYYSTEKVYVDKKYDLITSTEVAEHIQFPMEYFKLLKNLLKNDGLLAMMTLFHPKNDCKFCKWFYRRDKTHISFYAPETIEYIAKKLNMKVEYMDSKRCFSLSLK